jgi:hypothetical protein
MNTFRLAASAIAYLLGFSYSILVGGLLTKWVLRRFYMGYESGRTVENWRTAVVGFAERALYTTSWLLATPQFIAIWLALKVAGQWDRWKSDWAARERQAELKAGRDTARAMYAGYLLGNALSISFGVSGALIVQDLLRFRWPVALASAVAVPAAVALLYLYIRSHTIVAQPLPPPPPPKPAPKRKRRTA